MRVHESIRLREGAAGGGSVRCIIISEGLGNLRDANFYLPSAIKSAAKVLLGKQAYLNHPSASEEEDRPERSVRDLCGYWVNTRVGTVTDPNTGEEVSACFGTLKFDLSESGERARALVETALSYAKAFPEDKECYCGISINAGGVSEPGVIDGQRVNLVSKIQEAFSADIVTKPARGGRFLALVESHYGARHKLKQRRPTRPFGTNATEAMAIFSESYRKQLRAKGGDIYHG